MKQYLTPAKLNLFELFTNSINNLNFIVFIFFGLVLAVLMRSGPGPGAAASLDPAPTYKKYDFLKFDAVTI